MEELKHCSVNYQKIQDASTGLSTEEIMDICLQYMKGSRSILEYGCSHSDMQAEWIYYECKRYIEAYNKYEK